MSPLERLIDGGQPEIALEAAVAAIVERAQHGDREAFAELIRRFERAALAVAFAVLGDSDEAGEAVQVAFVRAWERLGRLRERERFGAWLCGIVRNQARDARRRGRRERLRRVDLPCLAVNRSGDPLLELERKESDQRVAAALESLDELSRTIVVLRYYESLKSREIGELLDLTPTAVDMRLSRARQQLRELLRDEPAR